jgi:hypothetical protein
MRLLTIGFALLLAMITVRNVSAQDIRYYTAHSTLNYVDNSGNVPKDETLLHSTFWSVKAHITESSGYKVSVNFSCVGIEQAIGSLFDRRVNCDHISESSNTTRSSIA